MPRIFISYRRADSQTITGRIYDSLATAFGEAQVFKDVYNIPAGVDFRAALAREVGMADVVLVVIGPSWVALTDDTGQRRLDDPNDYVRIEVEQALQRATTLVVPVLVGGAAMVRAADLPESLSELAYRNAAVVRDDPDFRRDIAQLIDHIKKHFEENAPTQRLQPIPQAAGRTTTAPAQPGVPSPAVDFDFDDLLPASTAPPSTSIPSSSSAPASKPSGSGMRWIWIIVGLFVLGLIALAICEVFSSLALLGSGYGW